VGDVTQLLGEMSRGDAAARDRLFGLVYGELMGLARGHLKRDWRKARAFLFDDLGR